MVKYKECKNKKIAMGCDNKYKKYLLKADAFYICCEEVGLF